MSIKKGTKVKIISDCRYRGKCGTVVKRVVLDETSPVVVVKMSDLCDILFFEDELEEIKNKDNKSKNE